MKTKLHLTLLAALCTMAALFTTSCSDDEPDRPTTQEEAAQMLVGQWTAIKVKNTKGNTSDIDNKYWEFTADGRYFVIDHVSPNATGRYEAYRNKWVIDETYGMARSYTLNFEPNDPTIFAVNPEGETGFLITQMTSNSFHVQYSVTEWVGGDLGYRYVLKDGPTMMRVKDLVVPTDTIPIPYKRQG